MSSPYTPRYYYIMNGSSLTRMETRAPSTFHRFNELPPELRDMIWDYAFPHTNAAMRGENMIAPGNTNRSDGGGGEKRDRNRNWDRISGSHALYDRVANRRSRS